MDSELTAKTNFTNIDNQDFIRLIESLDDEDIETILYIFTNSELKNLVKTFVKIRCCCDVEKSNKKSK